VLTLNYQRFTDCGNGVARIAKSVAARAGKLVRKNLGFLVENLKNFKFNFKFFSAYCKIYYISYFTY